MLELNRKPWDHMVIRLPSGRLGYAIALEGTRVAFIEVQVPEPRLLTDNELGPVAFVLNVHDAPGWVVVGNRVVPHIDTGSQRTYFVQIGHPPQFMIVQPNGEEKQATQEACEGLEEAVTHYPEGAEARLQQWLDGDHTIPRARIPTSPISRPPIAGPRGRVTQAANGLFRLDYADVMEPDTSMDDLIRRGFQGGGPSWVGIVRGLGSLVAPWLADATFDEEADVLVAWARNEKTLRALSLLLGQTKANKQLYQAAIDEAVKQGWME